MNMSIINHPQGNISINSYPNQQAMYPIPTSAFNSTKKISRKKQSAAPVYMDPLSMQMSMQQQCPFPNQQILPSNPIIIPQVYNKTMKTSFQQKANALIPAANKRRLHPKSKFTPNEDQKLRELVARYGENDWVNISKMMGTRNQRQCRERWMNYLSPNVCFAPWTSQEDELLKKLHEEIGAKWVKIASYFPNRTDTNIKNRWMVLQRQKKATESSKKLKGDIIQQEFILPNEPEIFIPNTTNKQEQLNENPIMLSFEADTQIDLMEDITSSHLFSSDYMFDMNWM